MKYQAEDGAVFNNADECLRYEAILEQQAKVEAEVDRYLDLQSWPKDEKSAARERTKARNNIVGWLNYDMRQNGERYGIDYEPNRPNDLWPQEVTA